MPDQPDPAAAAAKKPAAKKGAGRPGADQLAARLAGLGGPARPEAPAAAPGTARTARAPRAAAAGRKPAPNAGRGTRTVSTSAAAAMPAEQARPAAAYSARVSHATTPEQLAELEQIRLTENTARRAARRPAISITAMLRAAVAICLEDERLKARMIKRAGEEWN